MKKVFWGLVVVLHAMPLSSLQADIFSYGFAGGNITHTTTNYSIDTTGATGRARAYYVTGDWTNGYFAWSSEFRTRLVGLTDQGGGALDRAHGGLNNGNAFAFGAPNPTTWSNDTTNPLGLGHATYLADVAGADLGGTMTLGLRQGFAETNANLANAQVHFLTDIIAPVAVNTSTTFLTMTNRPSRLTGVTLGTFNYQALTFTALATGVHHIGLRTGGINGFLLAYNGAFDPTSVLTNLIGLDDIGDLGNANSSSMFLGLTAGQQYTFVATTFAAGANVTNGSFTVAGVPEPNSALLLGLFALPATLRRRR